jgi:hypothetical protein
MKASSVARGRGPERLASVGLCRTVVALYMAESLSAGLQALASNMVTSQNMTLPRTNIERG